MRFELFIPIFYISHLFIMQTLKPQNPIEILFDEFSTYHLYFFFFLFMAKIPLYWHIINLLFLSPPMNFYCTNELYASLNKSLSINACPCANVTWDKSTFQQTMQSKYDLACERAWMVSFSQTVYFVGSLIGSVAFGVLSDKFGRLTTMCTCFFIIGVCGSLVTVMPVSIAYIIMRILEGIGTGGGIVTSYVLCIEFCGVRYRETVTSLFHLPINIGHMALAGISYALRHCDKFQLAISIPILIFSALKLNLMESPKWLMDTNKIDKAAKVMKKFCEFNKKPCNLVKEAMEKYQSAHIKKESDVKMQFWDIFKHKTMTKDFFCMAFIQFFCGMSFYGVSQYIGQLGHDSIHLSHVISGAILIPGTIAAAFFIKLFKRRPFLGVTLFLTGVFMIINVCIPERYYWPRIFVSCIGECFIFMSLIVVFLYSVEIFPTSIRNSVLGVLSMLTRTGQSMGPLINTLPDIATGSIIGVTSIVGSILCIFLPETKGKELPATYEDFKEISKSTTKNTNKNDTGKVNKIENSNENANKTSEDNKVDTSGSKV